MSVKSDPVTKVIMENFPQDWCAFVGHPLGLRFGEDLKIADADLSTASKAADKVYDLGEDGLLHVEVQSYHLLELPERTMMQNSLIYNRYKYKRAVASVIVLLRPEASSPAFTGKHTRKHPQTGHETTFEYGLIQVWTLDPDALLEAGCGIWPLALITERSEGRLVEIMEKIDAGLAEANVTRMTRSDYRVQCGVLMGLRYERSVIETIIHRSDVMEESVYYQSIVQEGVEKGLRQGRRQTLRENILAFAPMKLGALPAHAASDLEAITEEARLVAIRDRLVTAELASWDDLIREE